MRLRAWGVVGLQRGLIETVAERAWNGGPEGVRVPYAKSEYDDWLGTRVGRVTRNPG